MVGRKVNLGREARAGAAPGAAARGRRVACRDALGVTRLHDVGLQLRAGEIVGIAGVSGNGQSELLDVLLAACAGREAGTLTAG
jgi:general nucleoside transport system ATP-binding protein